MAVMKRVRYPLKFKLLTLMLALVAASLSVFVLLALKTFREDKAAYIYETLLTKASSGQILLSSELKAAGFTSSKLVGNGLTSKDPAILSIIEKLQEKNSLFTSELVLNSAQELYRWEKGKLTKLEGPLKEFIDPLMKKSVNESVKEIQLPAGKLLIGFNYNPELDLAYLVSLPQEKAFSASTYLIEKSLFYGIFILGFALVISVLLGRPLTSQLEALFEVTQEIGQGNFQKRAQISGHDEVKALGDSFNEMADKIVIYMEEMKEKARLENEVTVAKLVQSSFFPHTDHPTGKVDVKGIFEPASECGGDWWGFTEQGDWQVFFIADATGHGVPAALLTATINSCKSTLGFLSEQRPDIFSRPDEILRFMNKAVCGAGKEIQVTCFVASFNHVTKELVYANASHAPALLFSGVKKDLTKDDFRPLIEANGPRLGQNSDSKFEVLRLTLAPHDILFLYTDGLIEASDSQGSRFGERRVIKSLSAHTPTPNTLIEGLMQELKSFTGNRPLADDLTAVVIKVNG